MWNDMWNRIVDDRDGFVRRRSLEAVVFLLVFAVPFALIGRAMGFANMFKTIMETAHDLLLNTAFYTMAVTVLTGAFSRLMIEFGVVRLVEVITAPLMRPVFNLPGSASLAGIVAFFSDNPAIIPLARERSFSCTFRRYELISLTNFGTTFGMGMIVMAFMSTIKVRDTGETLFMPAMMGLAGAVLGGVISTRLVQVLIKNRVEEEEENPMTKTRQTLSLKSEGSVTMRFLTLCSTEGRPAWSWELPSYRAYS